MTSHTLKRNDAAKAATSPRHAQSNPTKDQEMNAHASITPMVPFPAQTPFNEFDQAVIRIRIIGKLIDSRRSLDAEDINDIQTLLYDALDTLEPVGSYLDDIEYEPGHQERFVECRRRWLVKRTQGAAQ